MNKTSASTAEADDRLRDDLFTHLDEADFLARKYGPWSAQDSRSARTVIPELVTIIRCIVLMHDVPQPASPRWCATCSTDWPCTPFHNIYRLLKDPDNEFIKLVRAQLPGPTA